MNGATLKLPKGGRPVEWKDIAPVALAIGLLVLWLYVLPRFGVRTT